jgi:hypothetical protein
MIASLRRCHAVAKNLFVAGGGSLRPMAGSTASSSRIVDRQGGSHAPATPLRYVAGQLGCAVRDVRRFEPARVVRADAVANRGARLDRRLLAADELLDAPRVAVGSLKPKNVPPSRGSKT